MDNSLEEFLETMLDIKKPVLEGDTVFVFDGSGKPLTSHPAIELAKQFFSMSNDSFYRVYGFNWVPPEPFYSRAKRQLGR